jgi:hypothetical protein
MLPKVSSKHLLFAVPVVILGIALIAFLAVFKPGAGASRSESGTPTPTASTPSTPTPTASSSAGGSEDNRTQPERQALKQQIKVTRAKLLENFRNGSRFGDPPTRQEEELKQLWQEMNVLDRTNPEQKQ